jgi:hypothetical protein
MLFVDDADDARDTLAFPTRSRRPCTAPCCDASLAELREVALSSLVMSVSRPLSLAVPSAEFVGLPRHTPADAGRSMVPPSRTLRVFSTADVGRFALPT